MAFTYRADDGRLRSVPARVVIAVRPVNDPPVATPDAVATAASTAARIPVLDNGSVPDEGDTRAVTGHTDPAHGTVACAADACTYTPTGGFRGDDTFTYTVADRAGATATAPVTVTVAPVGVPVAAADRATTGEDRAVTVAVTANDALGDQPSTVTLARPPAHGTATCAAALCTYTPAADYHGPDAFAYTLADRDAETSTAEVTLAVTPVNDPPVLRTPPQTIAVGARPTPVTGADPDSNRVSFSLTGGTLPAGLTLASDGTFTGAAQSPGATTARLRVCDPEPACAEADQRIDVTAGPPVAPRAETTLPRTGEPATRPAVALALGLTLTGLLCRRIARTRRP